MRWAALFADLEAQLAAVADADLAGEVADRQRLEVARLELVDRLRAAVGTELAVGLVTGATEHAVVGGAGPDWVLLEATGRPDALVPLAAVTWLRGLPSYARVAASVGAVESRLDLGFVLRGLARDRAVVRLELADRTAVTGTIDRVGRDFLDLAEHAVDDVRRAEAVQAVRTVPFAGVAAVRPA